MSAARKFSLFVLALYFAYGPRALACVACGSTAARHLRHTLIASDFAPTLLGVMAPFPVLLLAALALCRWLAGASSRAPFGIFSKHDPS